jgi:hypothetical protein
MRSRIVVMVRHQNTLKRNQSGFVSIFTVLIIMSLLTITAVGFSNVTRQAQIRTLDNQLNTQAFYAAEAGINDAKNALLNDPNLTKEECQETPAMSGFNYTIDSNLDVGYSCLLVNSKVTDIVYNSVPIGGRGSGKQTYIESDDGSPIGEFTISWDAAEEGAALPDTNAPFLPPAGTWDNKVGILRFDLVPLNDLDRADMATNSYTTFLYPTSDTSQGGTEVTIQNTAITDKGHTLNTVCNVPPPELRCKARVIIFNPPTLPLTASKYALRLQSLYNSVKVRISDVKNTAGVTVKLINSQVVIDSTGKAGNVYRRIQVRLPLKTEYFNSDFALESADSICKRLQVRSDGTTILSTGNNSVDTDACAAQ